jgi:CDGSH-type Zn-finger protein
MLKNYAHLPASVIGQETSGNRFPADPFLGVNGPIWVRGEIPIQSADGKIYEVRNRVTLCRCGKSLNKPFCDSSHYPERSEGGKTMEKDFSALLVPVIGISPDPPKSHRKFIEKQGLNG